jgi:Asp-tRNA(Asn)/Glu-tRNA(Gln) amidotransferase A subunit family amidase
VTDKPLHQLSAAEVAAAISSGRVNCETIARACLERIEQREPVVRAWSFLDADLVLRQARRLDAQTTRGVLHGVPVGIKDVIDTHDMPTEMGSPIYQGYRPRADASVVALLRAAGALIVGKTVTCEFAFVAPGPTTNPRDPSHTPGGSSSGSAAAVADFMVPLAVGTQTGGSIVRPASYCGVIGYKPTFGLVNRAGVKQAAESLDTLGFIVRTVEDAAMACAAVTNAAPQEWLSANRPLTIGLCRTHLWESAQEEARQAIDDSAQRLARAGVAIREAKLPGFFSAALSSTREIINDYERAGSMGHEWAYHRDALSEPLKRSIRDGLLTPRAQFTHALAAVERCRAALPAVFDRVDALLTPSAAGEAPLGLEWTGDHRFQSLWTMLRTPTITLPTHIGPHGLPIGIQLIAPLYADNHLLAIARRIFDLLGSGA